MRNDEDNHGLMASIRLVTRKERGIAVRVFLSLAGTCVLIALALLAAYLLALARSDYDAQRGYYYFRVRDADLAITFAAASAAWLALLWWTWRGQTRYDSMIGPVVWTCVTAGAAITLGVAIDVFVRREEEFLIGATILMAVAMTFVIWMRYVNAMMKGKPVLGHDRQVNVTCPQCGYSLVGLNALRCPECGASFTIDELIRAQGYRGGETTPAASPRIDRDPVIRPPVIAAPAMEAHDPATQ
ncbi:MAG TPA: hypothetical protein P5081_04035 [Phycisphaerae bacterium]|nr:hypothetical protein [Phycisphaerae bacterium]HRW52030.1 hypothetical protein [Phycisphaerae bacterium]